MLVIGLALLKCNNYDALSKELRKLTNLSHATIWSHINKYIPILTQINPEIDVKKWLPNPKELSYIMIKKKVEKISLEKTKIKGTLIKPESEVEWLSMIKKIKRKSQVHLIVKCNKCGKEFESKYNYLNRDRWSCGCSNPLYSSDSTYSFEQLKKEIEELGEKITGIKGSLIKPQNKIEFKEMRIKQNISPTQLKVKVKCNKCGKIWVTSVTSLLHHDHWCGRCTDSRVYTYNEIVKLVKDVTLNIIGLEGTLLKPKSKEEFNKLSNLFIPSQVPLKIKCGNCGNEITYNTQYLKQGLFPCTCTNLKYETIISWYFYKLLGKRFNHKSLSKLISNYSGKLEYDGFNKLLIKNNFISLGNHKIKLNENYIIKISKVPFISNFIQNRLFKFDLDMIEKFKDDFEKGVFQKGDKITIDLSFGTIDFIYNGKKLLLLNSYLKKDSYSLSTKEFLRIAFEFNGRQHYEFPNAFHKEIKDFFDQVVNDLLKKKLSYENNVFLITFPYWINLKMNDPQKIQNFIVEQFSKKLGIDLSYLPQYNHNDPEFGQFRINNF